MRRDNGRGLKEFSRLFLQLFLDLRCLYYGFLEKAWRGWKSLCSREMEPGSESSQHQKRKTVTHGLEDQKRVSDKRWKHFLLKLLKEMQVAEELHIMLLSLALAARYAQPAVDLFSWLYVLENVSLSLQASSTKSWGKGKLSYEWKKGKTSRILAVCGSKRHRVQMKCTDSYWVWAGYWFIGSFGVFFPVDVISGVVRKMLFLVL